MTSTPAPTVTVTPSTTVASVAWSPAPATTYTASDVSAMTSFTALLKDAAGNTITSNNTATITLSLTTGTSGSFGGTISKTVTAGSATFNAVTHTKAESIVIKATESTLSKNVSSSSITVSPGAFDLAHSIVSSAASVNSGSSITVTLTAKDKWDNPNPSGVTTVTFTSSSSPGSGSFGSVTNAGSGVYTSPFTGILAGSVTLGATINAGTVSSTPSPATITVNPGNVNDFLVTKSASPLTAGSNVNITVTAEDSAGNVVTGYNGTVTLSSDDGSWVVNTGVTTNPYTFVPGTDGGIRVWSVQLKTAQAPTTITANGSSKTGNTTITVNPAAADSISIVSGNNQNAAAGSYVASNIVFGFADQYGNAITNNAAPNNTISVTLSEIGDGSVSPSSFSALSGTGTATLPGGTSWQLKTLVGTNTLTATIGSHHVDVTATGIAGTASKLGVTSDGLTSDTFASTTTNLGTLAVEIQDGNGNPTNTTGTSIQMKTYDSLAHCTAESALADWGASVNSNGSGQATLAGAAFSSVGSATDYWVRATATGLNPSPCHKITVYPKPTITVTGSNGSPAGFTCTDATHCNAGQTIPFTVAPGKTGSTLTLSATASGSYTAGTLDAISSGASTYHAPTAADACGQDTVTVSETINGVTQSNSLTAITVSQAPSLAHNLASNVGASDTFHNTNQDESRTITVTNSSCGASGAITAAPNGGDASAFNVTDVNCAGGFGRITNYTAPRSCTMTLYFKAATGASGSPLAPSSTFSTSIDFSGVSSPSASVSAEGTTGP